MNLYEELWELWRPVQADMPGATDALFKFHAEMNRRGLKIETVLDTAPGEIPRATPWLVGGVMYFPFDK